MRKLFIMLCILLSQTLPAQPEMATVATQQQLEELSEKKAAAIEDDSFLERLQLFSKHPLNLNKADKESLEQLGMLTEIQICQLLSYRRLLGNLINLYELQAVPGWDISMIEKLLPYITLADPLKEWSNLKNWRAPDQSLLLRYTSILEKADGYKTDTSGKRRYPGSPARSYLRYQYKVKGGLQLSLLGEKDPGEPFFRGSQKTGFDFYSFHISIGKIGVLRQLVIGDYTVSMAQGLIQWQGLSLGMGSGLVAAERQSPVLHPYSSPGELSFHRGAAISLQKSNCELNAFFSLRRLSANLDTDSNSQQAYITSLLPSGYHRTASELFTKNNILRVSTGGAFCYSTPAMRITLQAVHHDFSNAFRKDDQPYNLFALKGRAFTNVSVGYSYTHRNVHVFGETAVDKNFHHASINGLLVSLHPKLDLALVQRMIDPQYTSIEASASTQNTEPVNEKGLYVGVTLRPSDPLVIEAAADLYSFPWLRYRIDAPSQGKEYSLQINCKPTKLVELVSRFRWQERPLSATGNDGVTSVVKGVQQTNWRLQINITIRKNIVVQNRCEMVWYNTKQPDAEEGYLFFSDVSYQATRLPFSGNVRMQYVETDGYNSRLYAYENGVRYGFSIPAFFEKGFRYYGNLHVDVSNILRRKGKLQIDCWARWAQSIYPGKKEMGEGSDRVGGNKKSELSLQLILNR